MKIIKQRIVKTENYLSTIKDGESFHIAFRDINNKLERTEQIGFSKHLEIGECILPKSLGPISRFNSEGRKIVRRDLEKETFYVSRYWEWTDWGGNSHSAYVDIPRKRYPRDFVSPPSEELLVDNYKDSKIIVSRELSKNEQNLESIKHLINLFLELFGECDLIRENYQPFIHENIIRLNWKIFPQGEHPWERIKEIVYERIERQLKGNRPVIKHQFEIITNHVTNFVAIGEGGFNDYVVFGFPQKDFFILESLKTGNATYIFDRDWERFSKLTKAEVLDNNFQRDRIFHTPNWEVRINELFD